MKTRFNLAALSACILLSALSLQSHAQEQPKPGPEHKKLEISVGDWTYEGSGQATPFLAAAGKFKGKFTSRMVLGGFFVESRGEDKSDNGYIYQNVSVSGYDPARKEYVSHAFENDGSVTKSQFVISGNVWTSMGTRSDATGKVYKIKTANTFSPDGKTSKDVTEYSADDRKTWIKCWESTATKVGR